MYYEIDRKIFESIIVGKVLKFYSLTESSSKQSKTHLYVEILFLKLFHIRKQRIFSDRHCQAWDGLVYSCLVNGVKHVVSYSATFQWIEYYNLKTVYMIS